MNTNYSSLFNLIKSSAKVAPANKLAMGVAGVACTASLILGALKDIRLAVFGILIAFIFMAIHMILGWAKSSQNSHQKLISIFLWFCLVAFCLSITLLFTSFSIGWPKHATDILFPKTSTTNEKQVEKESTSTEEQTGNELVSIANIIKLSDLTGSKYDFSPLKSYFEKHYISYKPIEKLKEIECEINIQQVGSVVFIISKSQYNQPGMLIAIDSKKNTILTSDEDYLYGIVESKVLRDTKAEPEGLLVVKYITMTGTGINAESVKIYAVSDSQVTQVLDLPYSEVNAWGGGIFKHDEVTFRLENNYLVLNGSYEIHRTGVVVIEDDGKKKITREIPEERYAWDRSSKKFIQTKGRVTSDKNYLSEIYGDIGDAAGDWFKKPKEIETASYLLKFKPETW